MAKMYLEINNGGKDILVTDEQGHWYYAPTESTYFCNVDLYPHTESFPDEVMHVLYMLRREIKAGTTHGAQDVLDDMNDDERAEREIAVFHGLQTIDDVDKYVNFIYTDAGDHVRRAHDEAFWLEV